MSLQEADREAGAHAVAPRVSLADIESGILTVNYQTADLAFGADVPQLKTMTLCALVMRNGFVVIGKSAPASPENFNAQLGAKFAREDAIRQLWPLMGFALRDKLAGL